MSLYQYQPAVADGRYTVTLRSTGEVIGQVYRKRTHYNLQRPLTVTSWHAVPAGVTRALDVSHSTRTAAADALAEHAEAQRIQAVGPRVVVEQIEQGGGFQAMVVEPDGSVSFTVATATREQALAEADALAGTSIEQVYMVLMDGTTAEDDDGLHVYVDGQRALDALVRLDRQYGGEHVVLLQVLRSDECDADDLGELVGYARVREAVR